MKDRRNVLTILVGALILEGFLLFRSGLVTRLMSGPHSADELRLLIFDWRTLMSVGLVSVILWLAVRWFSLARASHRSQDEEGGLK